MGKQDIRIGRCIIRGCEALPDEALERVLRTLRGWWETVVDQNAIAPGFCHLPLLAALIRQTLAHDPEHPHMVELRELLSALMPLDNRIHATYGMNHAGFTEMAVLATPWTDPTRMIVVSLVAVENPCEPDHRAWKLRPRGPGEAFPYACRICNTASNH